MRKIPDPRPPEQRLEDVRIKLIEHYAQMIRLLEEECHPNRLETEMAFERHLQSRYSTCWIEKQREDRRNALA